MADVRRLAGLVLAGGASRRMGRDKALLQRDDQSQLNYAFTLLSQVCDETFVSTSANQAGDEERARYPRIVDRYDDIGPIAGILTALETTDDCDWLVIACDLPNIDRTTLDYLVRHASKEKPFTAFQSSHDGLPEPLCAIYRAGSELILQQFIAEGMVCPRKVLIRSDTELLQQPAPTALDNVNTPDDLAASVLEISS